MDDLAKLTFAKTVHLGRITHQADAVLDELRRILALRAREFAA